MKAKLKQRIRRKIARSGLDWARNDYITHPERWFTLTLEDRVKFVTKTGT